MCMAVLGDFPTQVKTTNQKKRGELNTRPFSTSRRPLTNELWLSRARSIGGVGLLFCSDRVDVQAESLGDDASVGRIGLVEVLDCSS